MIQVLIYFLIALTLSIDSFSMSLSVATLSHQKKNIRNLSILVGLFHLIMPIIGSYVGNILLKKITIHTNIISSLIFLLIAINLLLEKDKSKEIKSLNLLILLLLSLTVSIDSFNVGLAIGMSKESIILPSIIFMIISFLSTKFGFLLGKQLQNKYQNSSIYLGVFILIIISIKYLFWG